LAGVSERFQVVPAAYVMLRRADACGAEQVLLQLRQGTGYMDGHWAVAAAGHVEQGEPVTAAACREVAEELAVVVQPGDLVAVTVMHRTGRTGLPVDERVDFFFSTRRWSGRPRLVEPDKAAAIGWFPLDALPQPLVPHERYVIESLSGGGPAAVCVFGFGPAG
jgi:8-oxo-dGTP diphosphatase